LENIESYVNIGVYIYYGVLKMKRVSMFFSLELIERLRIAKERTGVPFAEFIRRAVVRALDEAGL